jgi:hypothetical protein
MALETAFKFLPMPEALIQIPGFRELEIEISCLWFEAAVGSLCHTRMNPGEALDVAAQVAVTLAGFAGIVVVFRPQSIHEWSAVDRLRLRLLLANSALPLITALFAILLLTIEPPPAAIWRWCSGAALALMLPFIIANSRNTRRIPTAEKPAVNTKLYYSLALLGTGGLVLQVINIFWWNQFWPFFACIFIYLVAAIAQFVRFVLLPPHR